MLTQKLEKLGARVAARLGKEITHIIFQRQRGSDKQEQDLEDIELRSLHDRAAKVRLLAPQHLIPHFCYVPAAQLETTIMYISCRYYPSDK